LHWDYPIISLPQKGFSKETTEILPVDILPVNMQGCSSDYLIISLFCEEYPLCLMSCILEIALNIPIAGFFSEIV
jgi:hypothetical protein